MRHRPIGLGGQGLADAFMILRMPFESDAARQLNEDIFETIYFAACEASCELSAIHGHYESFLGSPASQGKLQFDLWRRGARCDPAPEGRRAQICVRWLQRLAFSRAGIETCGRRLPILCS